MELVLPLADGGSDLVMLVEEIAERDTNYFVELTWLGEGALEAEVPGNSDGNTLEMLMELARAIRPDRVVFKKALICVSLSTGRQRPL
nr:hypothetical protein [Marinicella sp. W31]MDC2877272.1 hypothetical protein [Marinicella sp. W31]